MENYSFNAYLDEKNTITIVTDKESSFKINEAFLPSFFAYRHNQYFIYKAHVELDFNHTYILTDDFNRTCKLKIRYFVKEDSFDEMFYYDNDDLGATYNKEHTIFKLWAPIASKVILHYEINNNEYEVNMIKQDKGVFEIKINGDLAHALYYYKVCNNDVEQITLDPYAYSSNANSKKSAVIDLSLINTNGDTNSLKEIKNINEAIIYELSVRDFSISGALGEDCGTFKAFLKTGIKDENNNSIGIDHIKNLGVTHIQLMPILDFVTVNEIDIKEKYNWGYDPFCYNSLEGSYCSNPHDPYCRIKEAKEMIDFLHQNGLRVVLDVVFNHTYSLIDSIYNKIVPNYYYLMDRNGNYSNGSYCGNDIDSTRKMVYKYIVDMCVRYVTLYKIDGLRFDLMGILTKDLIMEVYKKCKAINPSFIIYGEGWNMPSMLPEYKRASLNNANQIPSIGFFNDYFRDITSGKSFNNFSNIGGYLTGNIDKWYDFLKAMRGSIENGCYFLNPTSSINYVECHDNFTLFDKLIITNPNNTEEERNRIQLCCLAATILAQGTPFIHAGSEFNRTKKGNGNSYNSGDKINMLKWENVDKYAANIKAVKDFIKIRKSFKCFNLTDRKTILNSIDGQILNNCVLLITYATADDFVLLVFNPTNVKQKISLNGDYKLYANQYGFVKESDTTFNSFKIQPYSFMMFTK